MIARYDRPVSAAAFTARRVAIFALVLFGAATFAHRVASLAAPAFVAVAGLAAALSILAGLLALFGVWRLWKVGAKGGWASLSALVAAAIVLAPVGYAGWLYVSRPAVYDVSSDPADPPQWLVQPEANQQWLPRRANRAKGQADTAYPAIVGRRYEGAMDRVLQAVKMALRDENMKVVAETGTEGSPAVAPAPDTPAPDRPAPAPDDAAAVSPVPAGAIPIPTSRPSPLILSEAPSAPRVVRIQAVHRSAVFGLTSDVVIRLTEDAETTVVDMRAASRYGNSDLGSGAALIHSFFDSLDTELLGIAGS